MPRHHTIWDAAQQKQIDVPFSPAEEDQKDAEEQAWANGANDRAFVELRKERNSLLAATDWWASSDLSITDAQTAYRAALRDLPANTADLTNPTWPEEPS
tara:strand:+ start:1101 stop:1400 length:300 start_codon:yes stop_codon:yes gene_type:complete